MSHNLTDTSSESEPSVVFPDHVADAVPGLVPDPRVKPWMTVPQGGKVFGLDRAASYNAAKRGDIPTIRIGRRLFVPTAKLLAMLGLGSGAQA